MFQAASQHRFLFHCRQFKANILQSTRKRWNLYSATCIGLQCATLCMWCQVPLPFMKTYFLVTTFLESQLQMFQSCTSSTRAEAMPLLPSHFLKAGRSWIRVARCQEWFDTIATQQSKRGSTQSLIMPFSVMQCPETNIDMSIKNKAHYCFGKSPKLPNSGMPAHMHAASCT